jgi:hypothetical protein
LWASVGIDPVEIALPDGVGVTLRAYRLDALIATPDLSTRAAESAHDEPDGESDADDESDPDDEPGQADAQDEGFGTARGFAGARVFGATGALGAVGEVEADRLAQELADAREFGAAHNDDADAPETEPGATEEPAQPQEIPVFLATGGRLLLFRTEQGLVDFINSGAAHELTQLDTWPELAAKVKARDIVPLAEDTYELDLVVRNLRGGTDAWDLELLIKAGEVARDLGYALRMESMITAFAPGAPLDDLDDALRDASSGGLTGFLGRRKLKKIGAEAAPLAWRTIIGKISSVADWRD